MEQSEKYKLTPEEKYWVERRPNRYRWDEWGSPVGLALGFAITLTSIGVFVLLLHLAGILR